ncbi:MAG: ADP-ribosylglycohydrolase family protein, partial [Acidobacteriota bacterium]
MAINNNQNLSKFAGCLLGGAVGDALGAAVEFKTTDAIRDFYGPEGITDYDFAFGRRGAITDDTQMTLFTAEALLRSVTQRHLHGESDQVAELHRAYLRWLHTQNHHSKSPYFQPESFNGWLIGIKDLYSRRAPGLTCLSALSAREMGSVANPLNNSKGCGGVMRVAPIGLVATSPAQAFQLGVAAAAITHSHPSGYYSSGCFAAIIRLLLDGQPLETAIEMTLDLLERPENTDHEECARSIRQALNFWRDQSHPPSPQVVEWIGGGWVGEEALAISLYCALAAQDDFSRGVLLSVNHSGDSDSTGSITGNILGLILGSEAIPAGWLDQLELRQVIQSIASDLANPDPA